MVFYRKFTCFIEKSYQYHIDDSKGYVIIISTVTGYPVREGYIGKRDRIPEQRYRIQTVQRGIQGKVLPGIWAGAASNQRCAGNALYDAEDGTGIHCEASR